MIKINQSYSLLILDMMNIPKIPDKKTIAFTLLGIILYIGSSYLNILKTGAGDIGVFSGIGLIIVGTVAQIKNWLIYWNEKKKLRE